DLELDVAGDLPAHVLPAVERRDRLAVQRGAAGGVQDVDPLRAGVGVPVQRVEADLVRLAVGEVDVDGEGAGAVPGGGDAVGGADAGLLQRADVGGAGGPGVGALAGGHDGDVGGVAGQVVDDVVAVGAVGPLPVALRRRVHPHQRRRGGRRLRVAEVLA